MSASEIEHAASEWLAKLDQQAVPQTLRAEFDAWYAADPRHQVAFLRLQQTWQRLDRMAALRPALTNRRRAGWLRPTRWLTAAAAAAVVALAVFLARGAWLELPERQTHATSIGGYERVLLQDGSLLELNTQTQVSIELSAQRRLVRLIAGEATFKVAHDPQRPFIVVVDETAVRAIGTRFNVRRRGDRIEVLVTEGVVAVGSLGSLANPALQPQPSTPVLQAGRIAIAAPGGLQIRDVLDAEAGRRLAWRNGLLSFDGTTLREAAEEFSRYNRTQLVVDAQVGALRIGGQFRATNLEGFLKVMERGFGLRVVAEPDRIILQQADPARAPPQPTLAR